MILTLAAVALLAAAEAKQTVLVLDPRGEREALARAIGDDVAEILVRDARLHVVSPDDDVKLATLLAEKKASGCDSPSCRAELAAVVDARWVVAGAVETLEGSHRLALELLDVKEARVVLRVVRDEVEASRLRDDVPSAARELRDAMVPPIPLLERPLVVAGAALAVVGVAASAVCGLLLLEAQGTLLDPRTPGADKDQALNDGRGLLIGAALGGVGLGAGGLAMALGALE